MTAAADGEPLLNGTVQAEWVDYNDHMNVAYYPMAFDKAVDQIFTGWLALGPEFTRREKFGAFALQSMYHNLRELRNGQRYCIFGRILDFDEKFILLFLSMSRECDNVLAATCEQLLVGVDMVSRRSMPFPAPIYSAIGNVARRHVQLPRPRHAGRSIAIRGGDRSQRQRGPAATSYKD